MEELKKKYTPYTESERMSYIREYLSTSETKYQFAKRTSGRVGIPRDIVNACLFLAHEENDFVNGHNLVVDGGMTKRMIYIE